MSFNDLGWDAPLDACCRAHDLCPRSVGANSEVTTFFDTFTAVFINKSNFTLSDCVCDNILGNCLTHVGIRGAVIWAIYVTTVKECVRYYGIQPFGTLMLNYNSNRWLQ